MQQDPMMQNLLPFVREFIEVSLAMAQETVQSWVSFDFTAP